jgi:hypothetical protein
MSQTIAAPASSPRKLIIPARAAKLLNAETRTVEHVITSYTVDRDGDVVIPGGVDYSEFMQNPVVFLNHKSFAEPPIGRCVGMMPSDQEIVAQTQFAGLDQMHPQAEMIYRLYRDHFMKGWSIGFIPREKSPQSVLPGQWGVTILTSSLLEYSAVGIPSNASALMRACKAYGLPDGATEQDLYEEIMGPTKKWWDLMAPILATPEPSVKAPTPMITKGEVHYPLRWNPALDKAFDADRVYEPSSVEIAIAAEFLGVPVKLIRETRSQVPSVRMGSWLTALDEQLAADWTTVDLRNFDYSGKETPPVYKTIQLNSTKHDEFLVNGLRCLEAKDGSGRRMLLDVTPTWWGLAATEYAVEGKATNLIPKTWTRAHELKFLKGEAFSLSGDFIAKTDETWGQVFLPAAIEEPMQRVVGHVNAKGGSLPNRGVILMGPPGTGKTLLGRVMRNTAEATFIWLSARDFHYSGAVGGIVEAFELAKELAPSILFFEDVDNWLTDHSQDLMKTEMDGISQYKGVVTVITTNFPERIPKALIDRPGRFHDVLQLGLPDEAVRRRMLERWLPDLEPADADRAIEATKGYSGAHVRELANFVEVLRADDGLTLSAALTKALEKIAAQRDLIDSVQLGGSRYAFPKNLADMAAKAVAWGTSTMVTKGNGAPADNTRVVKTTVVAGNAGVPKIDAASPWDWRQAVTDLKTWATNEKDGFVPGKYARGFAVYDAERANDPEAYRFAHHVVEHGALKQHLGGTVQAMSVLLRAHHDTAPVNEVLSPDERQAIYDHLSAHLRAYDTAPPEFRSYTVDEWGALTAWWANPPATNGESITRTSGAVTVREVIVNDEPFLHAETKQDEPDVETSAVDDARMLLRSALKDLAGLLDKAADDDEAVILGMIDGVVTCLQYGQALDDEDAQEIEAVAKLLADLETKGRVGTAVAHTKLRTAHGMGTHMLRMVKEVAAAIETSMKPKDPKPEQEKEPSPPPQKGLDLAGVTAAVRRGVEQARGSEATNDAHAR